MTHPAPTHEDRAITSPVTEGMKAAGVAETKRFFHNGGSYAAHSERIYLAMRALDPAFVAAKGALQRAQRELEVGSLGARAVARRVVAALKLLNGETE